MLPGATELMKPPTRRKPRVRFEVGDIGLDGI
jgi:hypothetical protein